MPDGRPERESKPDEFQLRGWFALTGLLRQFSRPYFRRIGLVVILFAAQAAGALFLPNLNADIINDGIAKGNAGYVWQVGGIMLGIVLVLAVISVVAVYYSSQVSMRAGAGIRSAIYRRVSEFSVHEMNRFGIPSLINRNINDVQQVQLFLQMALTQLIIAVITSIGAMVMAIREGPELTPLIGASIGIVALIIVVLVMMVVPLARSVQVKLDRINLVLREQITGARVIRAFLRTRFEQDRFQDVNSGMTRILLRESRIFAATPPALLGILSLSSVGVIWFGGHFVSEGSISIGNMSAFLMYIMLTLIYALIAVNVIVLLPTAMASAERIQQALNAAPDMPAPARPVTPASATGTVEFQHVSFGYPGSERPVLDDLTFALFPGQITAIIGGTGSGKTTLLNLIPRFFDVTSGAVLVNGTDVREQSAEQLWSAIGLVPQTAFLFSGTVASNLRLGMPEAADGQLWNALETAQALEFVAGMPGQLDAPIDRGGANLSGGQRQRLCIARALIRRPCLYLFDDCFSALDAATDARLRHALRAETQEATVVIAAQRVSTIMDADQIIVVDDGGVAGIGTHHRLLADCNTYREIVTSQLGEEAAA